MLSSCAVIAVGIFVQPDTAFAQDGGENAGAAGNRDGIDTIIVTARRRDESLQDVGIAIDALGADAIEDRGISNATELTNAIPAISFTQGGSNITSVYMRGVGNNTTSSFNDPAVIPNYDGVSIGRASGVLGTAFFDIERVEVLKGPQGILYGRNSTGGNINIIPARPQIGVFGAGGNLVIGNYDALGLDAFVNVPVGENAAFRFSGSRQRHDGYYSDGTGDQDVWAGRAQFLIEPTETLSVRIAGDYTSLGGLGPGASYIGQLQTLPPNFGGTDTPAGTFTYVPTTLFTPDDGLFTPEANAYRMTNFLAVSRSFTQPLTLPQSQDSAYWGLNAEVGIETGIGDITIIPAYRESKDDSFFYGPAFNRGQVHEKITQFSTEARLAGSAGMLDYVVGGIYYTESMSARNGYNQETILPVLAYEFDLESWAAFGQLTLNVTDSLRLIGGLRYTRDEKHMDGGTTAFVVQCTTNPPTPASPCAAPGAVPTLPDSTDLQEVLDFLVADGWVSPASVFNPTGGQSIWPLLNGLGRVTANPSAVDQILVNDRVTWRLGVEYDVAPDNLLYATVESGYRAGAVQLQVGLETYDPETIMAYTIGSKNRFLDDRLQLNIEGFYWNYKNQHATFALTDTAGVGRNATFNYGDATIYGFDLDIVARPTRNTTLGAKVQYLNATYDTAVISSAFPRSNFGCAATDTGELTGPATVQPIVSFDCSGESLLFSPEWTLNFDAEQVIPISDRLELVARGNAAFRDDQEGISSYTDYGEIPSYWIFDASLGVVDIDTGLSVTAFIRNIGDTRRNLFPQDNIGLIVAHWNPPRTYGVRASFEF
jgi:iron complex outermembrane receptor protein